MKRVDTMRGVVAWLQLADAEALAELRGFETAINEVCAQLCAVCEGARRLHQDVERLLATFAHERLLGGPELAGNAAAQAAMLWQIAAACGEIQRGVQCWGLGGSQGTRGEDAEHAAIALWRKKLS